MASMTRPQVILVALTVVLLFTWLMFRVNPHQGALSPRSAASAAGVTDDDSFGQRLRDRTQALRTHQTEPPRFVPAARNPFSFRDRPAAAPSARAVDPVPPAPTERPPDAIRSSLRLSGIAEEGQGASPARTAVISGGGQVLLLRDGDRFLSRFVVVRVAADAVQIKDVDSGDTFTLMIR
jgi:hypothetical protein